MRSDIDRYGNVPYSVLNLILIWVGVNCHKNAIFSNHDSSFKKNSGIWSISHLILLPQWPTRLHSEGYRTANEQHYMDEPVEVWISTCWLHTRTILTWCRNKRWAVGRKLQPNHVALSQPIHYHHLHLAEVVETTARDVKDGDDRSTAGIEITQFLTTVEVTYLSTCQLKILETQISFWTLKSHSSKSRTIILKLLPIWAQLCRICLMRHSRILRNSDRSSSSKICLQNTCEIPPESSQVFGVSTGFCNRSSGVGGEKRLFKADYLISTISAIWNPGNEVFNSRESSSFILSLKKRYSCDCSSLRLSSKQSMDVTLILSLYTAGEQREMFSA